MEAVGELDVRDMRDEVVDEIEIVNEVPLASSDV